jgi:NAD(P)-dependent dehydrogenase (short-subunit alcohol dehydrogenase family)
MATEFAPQGIRVNGILVGLIESGQWQRRFQAREDLSQDWTTWMKALAARKQIPLARLGLPEEAAKAIYFLATSQSSYTTGSHIDVSGGLSHHA